LANCQTWVLTKAGLASLAALTVSYQPVAAEENTKADSMDDYVPRQCSDDASLCVDAYDPGDRTWIRKQIIDYLKERKDIEKKDYKNIEKVTTKDFKAKVLESKLPAIVEFNAEWCSWCHKVMPDFDEICGKYKDKVKCLSYDVDQEGNIAGAYNVTLLPTFGFFDKGKVAKKHWFSGAVEKPELEKLIKAFIEEKR